MEGNSSPTTKKQVLQWLLEKIKTEKPYLIVGTDNPKMPDIHNFYPKEYYTSIRHLGFGFFEGKTEHGTFSFDAGGAMRHFRFQDKTWLSISPLRTENSQVLQDLKYNFETVKEELEKLLALQP